MAVTKVEMLPLHAADSLGGGGGVGGGGGSSSSAAASGSNNNTISAAADSSDNQPPTPQPVGANEQQQQQQQQQQQSHHPYATHHMYASSAAPSANGGNMPQMYTGMYSPAGGPELQQQQQQQHHQLAGGYASYLNSYEPTSYYQQQQQPTTLAALDYGNVGGSSTSSSSSLLFGSSSGDYKPSVRYNPYLNPSSAALHANNGSSGASATNGGQQHLLHQSSGSPKRLGDDNSSASTPSAAAVSTTTALSPRVVSSSSPSSTSQQKQQQRQQQHSGSPGCQQLQCKKCGILCSSEAELSAHISTQHGGSNSPYSGNGSFVNVPPQPPQQSGGNPGELLDLDSQKMVYPPTPGEYQQQLHSGLSSDALQSIHSMQQRSLSGWEQSQQQQQDGMSPYLQADQKAASAQATHSIQSPYYSPKQSPYHIKSEYPIIKSEYPVIKSEYPVIKSEYAADSQNYVDKSFDPTSAAELCQQQQQNTLLPVSSSPAEFPSTTTTPQQDQQQYRAQFEPPTSSSALPATNITAKAATWKSNEARRPKTYNCTACNKWFTSSGHLKRHYNTTLHKNAVKSSGQPDPATLPISIHHHPARDPTTKSSRRSKAEAAAAREQQQQQQQPPAPVQPPEPPRSPPEYASAQTAGGLAALSHYSASPSPTLHGQASSMSYAQQQSQQNGASSNTFQQQYLQQVQAAASHAGASNATVLNGHPNGLAGPSVQQQTLTSSQMRGLLNSTITTIVTKSEPLAEDQQQQQQQQQHQHSPMDIHMEMELSGEQQQQQQDRQGMQLVEMEQLLQQQQQQQTYQLDLRRPYHSSNPSNMPTQSPPLIISHQQYLEQQQQQLMEGSTFSRTPPTPHSTHMQAQHSIIAEPYNITVLGTSTTQLPPSLQQHSSSNMSPPLQQHNNSSMSPPPRRTTTATINSMGSIHTMQPASQQLQQPLQEHIMSSTLLSSTSNTLQQQLPPLDTIRNTIHTPTITHNTIRIPSFQQLQQQPVPGVLGAEPTMSYHTIIGNDQLTHADQQFFEHYTTQMLTSDGQLLQLIPTQQLMGQSFYRVGAVAQSFAPLTPYAAQQSPQEADLPPSDDDMQTHESSGSAMDGGGITATYSTLSARDNQIQSDNNNTNTNTNTVMMQMDDSLLMLTPKNTTIDAAVAKQPQKRVGGASKRKRIDSGGNGKTVGEMTPSGRIKCQQCEKTFTKTCYLTQHINCFHAGEYPFRCEKCGKRFQQEDAYEVHIERHQASEKAFKCHLCPKHYHHKTDLRRHIEGTHLNKKMHVCDVCEKSFCRFDHLQKHVSTHTRPRTTSKRAAAKTKVKATVDTVTVYNAADEDHVASSIDSVVKNDSGSNSNSSRSSNNVVNAGNEQQQHSLECLSSESDMKDDIVAAAAAAAFGSSDESDDQMMVIKTESSDEHEFLLESRSGHSSGVVSSYMLHSGEVLVKEIPIC